MRTSSLLLQNEVSRIIKPSFVLRIFWIGAAITTAAQLLSLFTLRVDTILLGYYSFLFHGFIFLWTIVVIALGKVTRARLLAIIGCFILEGDLFVARFLRDMPIG